MNICKGKIIKVLNDNNKQKYLRHISNLHGQNFKKKDEKFNIKTPP